LNFHLLTYYCHCPLTSAVAIPSPTFTLPLRLQEIQNEMEVNDKQYETQLQEKNGELESMKTALEEERSRYKELEKTHERHKEEQKGGDQQKFGGMSKVENEELISLRSEVAEYEV
jgi:flagellar motility protein MotE (MotC chaperone)